MQMSHKPYIISGRESLVRWPTQADPETSLQKPHPKQAYRIIAKSGRVYIQQGNVQYQCQLAAANIIYTGKDFDVWVRNRDLLWLLDGIARDVCPPVQSGTAVPGQHNPRPVELVLGDDGLLELRKGTFVFRLAWTQVAPSDFRDLFEEACVDMPDKAITSELAFDALGWLVTQLSQWKGAKNDLRARIRNDSITVATERAGSSLTGPTHLPQMDLSFQQATTLRQWLMRIAVKYIYVHPVQKYGLGYELVTMTSLDGADRLTMVVGTARSATPDQPILTPGLTPWLTQVEVQQLTDVVSKVSVCVGHSADLMDVETLGQDDSAGTGATFRYATDSIRLSGVLSCMCTGNCRKLQVHPRVIRRVMAAFGRQQTITVRIGADEAMIVMDDHDEQGQRPFHYSAWLRCTNRQSP